LVKHCSTVGRFVTNEHGQRVVCDGFSLELHATARPTLATFNYATERERS
jgi:hypothetical protein